MAENTSESERKDKDRRNLFDHAMKGEWNETVNIYKQLPWLRQEKMTVYGDTALHIAVLDGPTSVVKEMVELVSSREEYEGVLKSKNEQGNTPLHLAASMGNASMCKCILKKGEYLLPRIRNKDEGKDEDRLLRIRNKDGETPLFLATRYGQTEAFSCLLLETSESSLLRNNKGETILHCALAGGNFKLASIIIEKYENLGMMHDEKGVTPLRLLANQPTAFRSGANLISLIDRIIYHCIYISVLPPSSGDAEPSDHPAGRQTPLVKWLPAVPWISHIKELLFLMGTFIKICINPSNGARAKNARMDLDEENRFAPDGAGPPEPNNENGKRKGSSQRNYPVNYVTCFNFIMLLINAILGILFWGIGRSYLDNIREKKEKHVSCAKILEKIFDKAEDSWYDSTGKDPVYKDAATSYKVEDQGSDLSSQRPETNPDCEDKGQSSGAPGLDSSLKTPEKQLEPEKITKEGRNEKVVPKQVEEVPRSLDLMHKVLEEVQRSSDAMHKLLEQAQTNGLPVVNEKSQKMDKRIKEGTENKSFNEKGRDSSAGTPIFLVAVKNGIIEIVKKILQTHPAAIHELDPAKKNVLLLAVEHRNYAVINLLCKKYRNIKSAFRAVDKDGNNALHLAAAYTPGYWVGIPEGLQMQMEILAFENVKGLVPKHYFSNTNIYDDTPSDVFRNTHEKLLEKGQKWLKDTATQCSALAGIIASITFATSTSIPSSTNNNNGRRPSFDIQAWFTIFAVSSLIALSFSMTSAVVFLTIANSSYRLEDFARIVPRMLFFGFLTLYVSIGATLMSFCGAHIYTLAYKLRYASIPLYALVFLPLLLFSLAQIRTSYIRLPLATFKVNTEDIH